MLLWLKNQRKARYRTFQLSVALAAVVEAEGHGGAVVAHEERVGLAGRGGHVAAPKLKGSIGEGSNHSNFSDQVRVRSKFSQHRGHFASIHQIQKNASKKFTECSSRVGLQR